MSGQPTLPSRLCRAPDARIRHDGSVTCTHHAAAGAVAGLAGLAVSHAVTMLLHLRAAPAVAVAEAIRDITPGGLAEALIRVVGQLDKPLLAAGVLLGLLLLCAWAGALARRSRLLGLSLLVGLGVVGAAAVWTRPGSGVADLLPVLLGSSTGLAVLPFLLDALHRGTGAEESTASASGAATSPLSASRAAPNAAGGAVAASGAVRPERGRRHTRRDFLLRAGVVAGMAAVLGAGGEVLGRARRGVERTRELLRLPVTRGRVPAGAELEVPGIAPWRTGNADFYRIDTALVVPTVDPVDWRLRVHGMVDAELELTYRDLLDRQLTEAWVTICCVSNEVGGDLIGNAWWSGVRIADVLAEAGVHPDADAVLQTSQDGWTCGTPLAALTDKRNALLAIAMNGEPLPLEHGFPVRMVVPGLYGYVSATKWLADLKVSRFDRISAYWTERGWSELGPVKTQSRIDVPRDSDEVPAGIRAIGGSAWAQHTGIEAVEYRLDGEPWRTADLGRVPGVDTWVQWTARVQLSPGPHTLAVRATDRSGYTQTSVRRGVMPDGATGWHTVKFTAG